MLRVPAGSRPRRHSGARLAAAPVALLAVLLATPALAQDEVLARETYLTPPDAIADAVLAPRHLQVTLGALAPDGSRFVRVREDGPPRLADLAKPHHNLAGLEVDPRANRARRLTVRAAAGLDLISSADGSAVPVGVPAGARVSDPVWSPDGTRLAFFAHFEDATHVYVADPATGRSRQVTRTPVLATAATSFAWTADGRHLFAVLIPEGRGPPPTAPAVPATPLVRTARDAENRLRTFPSLLESPHQSALLEYYLTGQLARIEVDSRRVTRIGAPALLRGIDPSPDGRHVLVTRVARPFSNIVPFTMFGTVEEVWDLEGRALAEVNRNPVREGDRDEPPPWQPRDDDGRRQVAWRPDGAGLSFLQRDPAPDAEDGDAAEPDAVRAGAARRLDRVLLWRPPFDDDALEAVHETEGRIRSVHFTADAGTLLVTEAADRREHLYAVRRDDPDTRHTIYRHRTRDGEDHPGTLLLAPGSLGRDVVRTTPDGAAVFLSGTRHFEDPLADAPRPFVDRVEIASGETTRVWEGAADRYEQVVAVVGDGLRRVVLSRESPTEVPNSFVRDLEAGTERRLTENRDPAPAITAAQRRLIEVTRADGLRFWVRVTLPPDYAPGTRLPAMFWFYPREFADQEAYDRSNRTYNKNRFPAFGPRSMVILTRLGYAVVEPDSPIIGEEDRLNDHYVPDLRNNLSAVIDELDRLGFIDRSRLALGGHSYGGFGTVNAMVHTPFFRAGIAGAGNYNRSLTPIGFQRERRDLWRAREVYIRMSPIFWADQLNGSLLLYHGAEDQNVGTFPINSERLFHALNGLGKDVVLYMYPHEGHGPIARETLLDLWARWVAWLDRHLDEPARPVADAAGEEG